MAYALLDGAPMRTSDRLRIDLLAALATGSLIAGCGGKTDAGDLYGSGGGTGGSVATGGTTSFGGTTSTGGTISYGGAGGSGGTVYYGGAGGTSFGGAGGTSYGGAGGTSYGGAGGTSFGGAGGTGGNPIIIGTPTCDYSCIGPNWYTCWQPGTVPIYDGAETDPSLCPQGYNIDTNQFSPCYDPYYYVWYSGPVLVKGYEGMCCYDSGVACPGGRPFRIDGELRVADVCARADWGRCASTNVQPDMNDATRNAIARAWLADAQLEHASVAAFARLTLELMALGAPADLVRDSQLASLDEIEHAEICFGFAARYFGENYGPSALRLDGALDEIGLEHLLVSTIEEGCLGETLAALVAAEQSRRADDPAVAEALEKISRDESRHAALAWKVAKWVLDRAPELASVAVRAFEEHISTELARVVRPLDREVDAAAWSAAGRLSVHELASVRSEGVEKVIRPCMEALLGSRALAGLARLDSGTLRVGVAAGDANPA